MQGNIRCAAFEKSMQVYCTLTILIIWKKKEKKIHVNIAFIVITLPKLKTKHIMLLKKSKQKTTKKKQNKTNKNKNKTGQNCSDRIRTLSVNLQVSRSSDYTITSMVQWSNL